MTKLRALAVLTSFVALGARGAAAQGIDVEWPLGVGLRTPGYDRVNGASVPLGPRIVFGDERVVIDPVATYRSHLGKVDGALDVAAKLTADSSVTLSLGASRATFSNDAWIRSTLSNSLVTLWNGDDARNYFRGDRAEGKLGARLPGSLAGVSLFIGGRAERDWSTGWRAGERRGPFSVIDRSDTTAIQRPNPLVAPGHVYSVLGGGTVAYDWVRADVALDALVESALSRSVTGSFTQATLDVRGGVNTFASERLKVSAHLITTSGTTGAPPQRFGYLGGAGTLATIPLLSLGGDHLYFVDAEYQVPILGAELPFLGQPYVAPRFASGAASVGGFGIPTQNVGARVGAGYFSVDYIVNPRTHKHDFGFGLAINP